MALDRVNDHVYKATTSVVKAVSYLIVESLKLTIANLICFTHFQVMALSKGVDKADSTMYLELVRNVGEELRILLSAVDQLSPLFPTQAHK